MAEKRSQEEQVKIGMKRQKSEYKHDDVVTKDVKRTEDSEEYVVLKDRVEERGVKVSITRYDDILCDFIYLFILRSLNDTAKHTEVQVQESQEPVDLQPREEVVKEELVKEKEEVVKEEFFQPKEEQEEADQAKAGN